MGKPCEPAEPYARDGMAIRAGHRRLSAVAEWEPNAFSVRLNAVAAGRRRVYRPDLSHHSPA